MKDSNKLNIDISDDNKKTKVFQLFNEFKKISDIYDFFGVKDIQYNNK